MKKSNLLKLLSIIFTFALIAGACGGDDGDSGSSSDSSVLGDDSSEEEEAAPAEEAAEEEAPAEEAACEAEGLASDSILGDGAELWEWIVDCNVSAADDSLEPVLITLINIEGTPVGSFPDIREGAEAAVQAINETMGGLNGRPFDLDSCVHGLDPNEAIACANGVADAQPNLHIQGIDFFNPTLWPTLVGSGVAILQTVPIFIEDFNTPGLLSTEGGCVAAFPSAMQYGVEVVKADKFVILYSDSGPGLVCYEDTQKRMIQTLTDEGKIAQEDWIGVDDASGDPTDNDAVVQEVMEFTNGASNAWVYFGLQSTDCNEILSSLASNGYDGNIVMSGSCKDTSVLSNPASAGVHIGAACCIPDRPDLWDPYNVKYYDWRNANLDAFGPTVPRSSFMEIAHDVVMTSLIQMIRFVDSGGDIDNDPAGFMDFIGTQSNLHRTGNPSSIDCTQNSEEFVSVCQKEQGYYVWSGPGGQFDFGPLETQLDATDLILRTAIANPRPAAE